MGSCARRTFFLAFVFVLALPFPLAAQVRSAVPPLADGAVFRDCPECPEMVVVPPGRHTLAWPQEVRGQLVSLPRFAIGRSEVTWADIYACFAAGACRDSRLRLNDTVAANSREPFRASIGYADAVSDGRWEIVASYLDWLSARTGEVYRLPTNAEWEYAARGGSTTRYPWGESLEDVCEYANVPDLAYHAGHAVSPVGGLIGCNDGESGLADARRFRPNGFSIFDMIGNLQEWVATCARDVGPDLGYVAEEFNNPIGVFDQRAQDACGVRLSRGCTYQFCAPDDLVPNGGVSGRAAASLWLGFRVVRNIR
jgi:formylglycine-generating enzyme required for sulfatase activity